MPIKQMDTTKVGIKEYLDVAAEDTGKLFHSAETMRLAECRWFCDAAGITDVETRKAIGKQFMATPSWFGTNSSACRQAFEDAATGKEKVLKDYAV